jgi:DNA-binding XRE family transcriptional regulator
MTQAEAAKCLGISRNALVKYENSPFDIPRVVRLAIIGAEQEMQTT